MEEYNDKRTAWGKIYVITNKDYPKQVYVGSTEQTYICKRKYRHKKEHEWGNKSYGNLFATDNWECYVVEMEEGLVGIPLRMREREYYDCYKAMELDVCNQNLPWSSPEEKREARKLRKSIYYETITKPKNLKKRFTTSTPSSH